MPALASRVTVLSFLGRDAMPKIKSSALGLFCIVSLASCVLLAQVQRPGEYPRGEKPSPMMNFFVTSEPVGDGGNLGGLAGADAYCQKLATAAGAGNRTWHAYLSTQARPGAAGSERARPHRQRSLVQLPRGNDRAGSRAPARRYDGTCSSGK